MAVVKFYNLRTFTLSKENPETKKVSRLAWSVRNGYPRVSVFIDAPGADEKMDYNKIINAPMDFSSMYIFIDLVEKMIDKKPKAEKVIEQCFNLEFVDGKRTDNKYLQGVIEFFTDDIGLPYLRVTEPDKPVIEFAFEPSEYVKFRDRDGNEILDKVSRSLIEAKYYFKRLRACMEKIDKEINITVNEIEK